MWAVKFNGSLIGEGGRREGREAKSPGSVHKSEYLKRKVRRRKMEPLSGSLRAERLRCDITFPRRTTKLSCMLYSVMW